MNRQTLTILCVTFLAALWLLRPAITAAQNKTFAGVMPFVTSSGLLGLFNQNDGKLYIYDNNVSTCLYKGQIDELGKPIIKIEGETASAGYAAPPLK